MTNDRPDSRRRPAPRAAASDAGRAGASRPAAPLRPDRRHVLRTGLACLSAAVLAGGWRPVRGPGRPTVSARPRRDEPRATRRRPNVLYVLSDSHRAATVGCYGDARARTPHMDALADEGAQLTTAVSNTPVCRPYRASLMSGRFGHRNGMLTNVSPINFGVEGRQWRPGDVPLLGRTFRDAGYRCGYIGKWHLGHVALDPGPRRFGFDDYWAVGSKPVHDYREWTYYVGADEPVTGAGPFRATMETDLAIAFLEDAAARQGRAGDGAPFFLVLSWGPPHEPYEAPAGFREHHDDVPLPPNVLSEVARAFVADKVPHYYGLVEAIDHELGRLLAALDRTGLADDTIVVYTSDHGDQLGSHDYVGKEMPYTESSQVPFLARWPGRIPAGARPPEPFGAVDVFPTLCGLAGLAPPGDADGHDLSALLRGEPDAPAPDAAYLAVWEAPMIPPGGWRGVRTPRHLYARTRRRPWLLFDLDEDPHQLENLVQDDEPLRRRMDALTLELMEQLGDAWAV